MASPFTYQNGLNLAGTVFANGPDTLQLDGSSYLSQTPIWLDTISGSDSNGGTDPELPVKTLAQAVTLSVNGGIIVIGEGSSETLTVSQTLSLTNLSIFGCGTGSSRPRYTCAGAIAMFNVTGTGAWIENIYFPASTAVPTCRIDMAATNGMVKNCYFECGANDTTRALRIPAAGSGSRVVGCSFVTTALRPAVGLAVTGAAASIFVDGCTFDGGSYGWTSPSLHVTAAATGITYTNLVFTNRSDLVHAITGTTYHIFGIDMGGTGHVFLTA
jgi:hypothetical protein